MNTNREIVKLQKQISILLVKTNKLEESVKEVKKIIDKEKNHEKKKLRRTFSLIDRMEAEERMKNLMMPD
jgi:hypothetical protein